MNWNKVDYDNPQTLPAELKSVLICFSHDGINKRFVAEGWLESAREGRWKLEATDAYNDHQEYFGAQVSHWMPLPAPPRED